MPLWLRTSASTPGALARLDADGERLAEADLLALGQAQRDRGRVGLVRLRGRGRRRRRARRARRGTAGCGAVGDRDGRRRGRGGRALAVARARWGRRRCGTGRGVRRLGRRLARAPAPPAAPGGSVGGRRLRSRRRLLLGGLQDLRRDRLDDPGRVPAQVFAALAEVPVVGIFAAAAGADSHDSGGFFFGAFTRSRYAVCTGLNCLNATCDGGLDIFVDWLVAVHDELRRF